MPYKDVQKRISVALKWSKENPERFAEIQRKHRLKKLYNITPDIYKELLKAQNGCCAICGDRPRKKILSVDHNHITGKIRGLICNPCNIVIGNSKENPMILFNAMKYLEKYNNE